MLGKVFKHEMKSTARLFLPMMIGFVVVTLLCKLTFESSYSLFLDHGRLLDTIMMIFFCLYFIYVIALFVMTGVFIAMHFYKTMAGDQGYLTNTLPVKASTLIQAKTLAAVIWEIIAGALLFLSFILFFIGHIQMYDLLEFFGNLRDLYHELALYMNMPLLITEAVIILILELISGPLMLYAAVALGHLFRKHRVLWAVVSYFVIYVALQIITSTFFTALSYSSFLFRSSVDTYRVMGDFILFTIVVSALCTAGFYAITNYIFARRLNLD